MMFEGVIRGGVRNVNAGNALSNTSATTIYTVPTNHSALIPMIWLTNADASAAQYATVTWRDSSASTTYNLIYQKDGAAKVGNVVSDGAYDTQNATEKSLVRRQ